MSAPMTLMAPANLPAAAASSAGGAACTSGAGTSATGLSSTNPSTKSSSRSSSLLPLDSATVAAAGSAVQDPNEPADFGSALLQAASEAAAQADDAGTAPTAPSSRAAKPSSDKHADIAPALPAGFAPVVAAIAPDSAALATTTGANGAVGPAAAAAAAPITAASGSTSLPTPAQSAGVAPEATHVPAGSAPATNIELASTAVTARTSEPTRTGSRDNADAKHAASDAAPSPFALAAASGSNPSTQSVTSAQPTQPTPTAATERPAVAAQVEQPALASALGKLHSRVDGAHEITVALHPADLGSVRVHARLQDGTLDVTVACADDAARQAVTAALPALHQELAALGSVTVALDASAGQAGGQSNPQTAGQHSTQPHHNDESAQQRRPFDDSTPRDRDTARRDRAAHDGLDRWM